MPEAPVTNVSVTCVAAYLIKGNLSGLAGTGLVLRNNGGDDLTLTAGATSYAFNQPKITGDNYNATIQAQPINPWQTCSYSSTPSGIVATSDVTLPALDCVTNLYNVIVNISGLVTTGMELDLNGGAPVTIAPGTTQVNLGPLASGSAYTIGLTSPVGQTCSIFGGAGSVTNGDITATISCTTATIYSIGGSLSGLAGSGLQISLTGTATESIAVPAPTTSYAFTSDFYNGDSYTVDIAAQPTNPWQTCVLPGSPLSGTVTGPVTLPAITCTTNNYNVIANVTGQLFAGLSLQVNTNTPVTINAGDSGVSVGSLASLTPFTVTIASQPVGQVCSITAGDTGTITGTDVTVSVSCTSTTYTISGNLSNLSGSGMVLELSKGGSPVETISPSVNGSYSFTTNLIHADTYSVAVTTPPTSPSQSCTFASAASGTVAAANVVLPQLDCSTNNYSVNVTISGYSVLSGLQLQLNGGAVQNVTLGSTSFTLGSLASGTGYTVDIIASGTGQSCSFPGPSSSATGTVTTGNVNAGTITCTQTPYTVDGAISGLDGSGLQLSMTGSVPQTVNPAATATSYTFGTPLIYGNNYTVNIAAQPTTPWQTCTPTSLGSGTISNNVTLPAITCTTNNYNVIANVTGNAASGLELQVNALTPITFAASETGVSLGTLASGTAYTASITATPAGYTCSITTGASGTIAGADAIVSVSCSIVVVACDSFFIRDDSSWDSWYGVAQPTSYGNAGAAGGSFSGNSTDNSGYIYNFNSMCAGNYYVWVNGFDIGASTDKSYGYWDFTSTGNPPSGYDWYAFDSFGWKRTTSAKALSAGNHSWQLGSLPDGNWFSVGWDQIIVTQDQYFTPSGVIPNPLVTDSLDTYAGWNNQSGGSLTVTSDTTSPATGAASMKMTGSSGHYLGVKKSFGASQPQYIGLWMRQDTAGTGPYLVVGGPGTTNANVVVFMYFNSGSMQVSQGGANPSPNLGAYTVGQWYFIEIKNINWSTYTMDYYVNGVLKSAGVGFRTNQTSVSELHFYSLGAGGSYDNIVIY